MKLRSTILSLKPNISLQIIIPDTPAKIKQGSIFSLKDLRFSATENDLARFSKMRAPDEIERIKKEGFTFQDFYPFTEFDITTDDLAIIVTQTCDLEKGKEEIAEYKDKKITPKTITRVPKVPFINISILEPFERLVLNTIERHGKLNEILLRVNLDKQDSIFVVCPDRIYSKESIAEIISTFNNDHKHIFFVAISSDKGITLKGIDLSKIFPIRVDHYENISAHIKFELKDEFANALGWKIAELYGRVGLTTYSVSSIVDLEGAFRDSLNNMFAQAKKANPTNFQKLKDAYSNGKLDRVQDLLQKELDA